MRAIESRLGDVRGKATLAAQLTAFRRDFEKADRTNKLLVGELAKRVGSRSFVKMLPPRLMYPEPASIEADDYGDAGTERLQHELAVRVGIFCDTSAGPGLYLPFPGARVSHGGFAFSRDEVARDACVLALAVDAEHQFLQVVPASVGLVGELVDDAGGQIGVIEFDYCNDADLPEATAKHVETGERVRVRPTKHPVDGRIVWVRANQ